jgi:hypothetical protein
MWFLYIVAAITLIVSLVSLAVLVFIGIFLVNFRDDLRKFFEGLVEVMSLLDKEDEAPVPPVRMTWDEKYELVMDEIDRRRKAEMGSSGLIDPEKGNNYGVPPAATEQEGLIVTDK